MSELLSQAATALRKVVSLVLLCFATGVFAGTLHGEVIRVADGDTVTVLDRQKRSFRVRLAGIDAPERSQAFGTRARQHLAALVFRKHVSVEHEKVDRYGRIVGKVVIDGVDVNLEMLRSGFAWHYKTYEAEQNPADRAAYSHAEMDAQRARRGLWADRNPVAPWEFRRLR